MCLLSIFQREFRSQTSHLSEFIRACAHGNMRLALDSFREFMLSGYTRIDEMLARPSWTLQVHQVLRPMMVPYRYFYDESKSDIPNLFQIRSPERGSNLTGLRLLRFLAQGQAVTNPNYVPIAKIRDYFGTTLRMWDDAQLNLDVFLQKGILESNKRIDFFSEEIDSIKLTPYGFLFAGKPYHTTSRIWTLFSVDCAVHSESVADDIANCANSEVSSLVAKDKKKRMAVRIEKVRAFLDYLEREEEIEREHVFPNAREPRLVSNLRTLYDFDEKNVLRSAARNLKERPDDEYGEFDHIGEDTDADQTQDEAANSAEES